MAVPLRQLKVGRRKFLSGVAGFAACVAASAGGVSVVEYTRSLERGEGPAGRWLDLAPLADLTPGVPSGYPFSRKVPEGQGEVTQTGVAYAITHDGQDLRVFANICTHRGCRVHWNGDEKRFICPCHGSIFDADGGVLAGPAQRALEPFETRVEDGLIKIRLDSA